MEICRNCSVPLKRPYTDTIHHTNWGEFCSINCAKIYAHDEGGTTKYIEEEPIEEDSS